MRSALTWLDYSERDRRNALAVIDLFRETGTVDELGLAGVRDSFSDLFFPGTSTIQTRACYFLLVPWTCLEVERLKVASSQAPRRARRAELELNQRLREGNDTRGVFGGRSGDALKRLPSAVYWGGLGSWGIRLFPGHISAYFRSLDGFQRRLGRFRNTPPRPGGRERASRELASSPPGPSRRFSCGERLCCTPAPGRRIPSRTDSIPSSRESARRAGGPGGSCGPRCGLAVGAGAPYRGGVRSEGAAARRQAIRRVHARGGASLQSHALGAQEARRVGGDVPG